MPKRKRLVIIDAHALIHRAYHAIPPLTDKSGEVVNAVFGFTTILLSVLRDLKPEYVAVAFDLPGKTKRQEEYDLYKANRSKAPDDLISQFSKVKEVVSAFNIPVYEVVGYEADDVIGTIAQNSPADVENFIVTGDMDELQLVNDRTKVYTMRRGFSDTVIYDEAAVIERYHLTPAQFVDYKALKGDPSDNIPGVAGIGEKTAQDLIGAHHSLDEIYQNIETIKPAVAKKLLAGKEMAYLSQKLSRIETGLPIELDLKCCILHDFDRNKVLTIFQRFGFNSLLAKIPGQPKEVGATENSTEQVPLNRDHLKKANYTLVDNTATLKKLIADISKKPIIAIDTETDSLNQVSANLVGISLCFKAGEAFYIPITNQKVSGWGAVLIDVLGPVLGDPKIKKVGHNIKFDYVVLKQFGINLSPITFDTMIAAYLLNPVLRAQKLSALSLSELGIDMIEIEELIGKGKNQMSFAQVDQEKAAEYACEDADITWRLYEVFGPKLASLGMTDLMANIEAPLVSILGEMERTGILLDNKVLEEISVESGKRIIELEKSIKSHAGEDFNIASPNQLQNVLYTKLRLHEKIAEPKDLKKLKNGFPSTSAQELEKLRGTHPIVAEVFEYRELTKLKSTYLDALPKLISPKTGRIHTNYNQTIAQTGRLSSTDPNLQNIPIRTEAGKKIRAAFIAPKGKVLLSADYSQIELRMVAHLANDPQMLKTFNEQRDIHTETAAKVYDIPAKEVTSAMRRIAKIINFGILYGVSAHGLHTQTGVTREEGKKLIEKYFAAHPAIKSYSDEMIAQAKELGYVETLFGRRRFLPEIKSSNFMVRAAAERMAINMPVQGTAADLLKIAMIDIAKELDKVSPESKMLLQVHDELVFEVPEKEAEIVANFVKDKMNNVVKLSVPIETSVAWGKNWELAK